jgi:hypothetical protein
VDYEHFIFDQPATKEAAKSLLNLDELRLRRVLSIKSGSGGLPSGHTGVSLQVSIADDIGGRAAAAEFLQAVIARLPEQLTNYQQSFVMQEVDAVREQQRRAEKELGQLRGERAARRQRLRDLTGRTDAAANWDGAVAKLEQERQKLTMDLAGQQARRKAIEKTIAATAKQAEERAEDDPIAVELAKIVELRMVEAQRMRNLFEQGRFSQTEISELEAKVADAKARLLERRELAARAAGGEFLSDLNRELLMLSINAAESEARLELIARTLNGFVEAAGDVERLGLLEKDLASAEATYLDAKKRAAGVEDTYRNLREPKVTLLDYGHVFKDQARERPGEQ